MKPVLIIAALFAVWSALSVRAFSSDPHDLEVNFIHPPDSARPWVYWFWNNGNVTQEGITADLQAMKRVGIGGVIIMDVVERFGPPTGTATFMGTEWQDLFQFALSEAHRLGLEVNMTNGPGWCGSSGPWITPELSMQTLVETETVVEGPRNFDGVLDQPKLKTVKPKDVLTSSLSAPDFYRDIAVLAFLEPVNDIVPRDQIVNLTTMMDKNGRLLWKIPPGKWLIKRIGHTSTGSSTRPPVVGGNGLECDKLSKEAIDVHFAGMMKKIVDRAGPLAGQTLVATHIDSWEVGKQNWTSRFREEFQKRRGYDPVPLLPNVISNLQIGSKDFAERFRWDFNETIAELLAQNYSGRMAELAHQSGLRFTLEGYELPFGDEATYTAAADEPMTEFWTAGRYGAKLTQIKGHQMASVSHLYGRVVTGAESFTSDDKEKWKLYPATIKALGDYELCQGVNRFVIHRYAHQPFLDRFPGVTMGPWGLHYERTNTWWEMSGPWHDYVARCSYLLRQGNFVADLLYARPERPNQTYFSPNPELPPGYNYDEASAQAIIDRASVKDGRIVLPDGMSYGVMILPNSKTMTPEFLRKIKELVAKGATVSGAPPHASPSLKDFPNCDREVANMAKELWSDCDGKLVTEHAYGKGRICYGQSLPDLLQKLKAPPDFYSDVKLNWIHRHLDNAEIYFLANPNSIEVSTHCSFRVTGLRAEAWNPEDGTFSEVTSTSRDATHTNYHIQLGPTSSTFIVFRPSDVLSSPLTQPITHAKEAAMISGPWEVHFPKGGGAPNDAPFHHLISWSESTDNGIKYFSGTAIYKKTFSADPQWLSPNYRIELDLGSVEVMARVKLNGKDLGILWKSPYRIEITQGLKPEVNTLEVSVANLWPNRMIGDSFLAADQRLTWSTWSPFTKADMLLKSGLIGPVTLRVQTP